MGDRIVVSNYAMSLLRAEAEPGRDFIQTGRRLPDGSWELIIGDNMRQLICRHRELGASDEDVIVRLTLAATGHSLN